MSAAGVDSVVRLLAYVPWAAIPVLLIAGELRAEFRRRREARAKQRSAS